MAEETKIGIKLEEETKPIKKMCEKLMDAVNHELDKGIENIDTKELGEAIDMIKDLYEAKEKLVKSCYYKSVIEAMEEHDFEDEEEIMDEGRRDYRGQPRDSRGRYMSRRGGRRGYEEPMYYQMTPEMYHMYPAEYYRDMDRESGKMYYSGGSSNSGGSSRGGQGGSMSSMSSGNSGMMGSQGGSREYSDGDRGQSSRSENARRGYEEAKMMQDGSPESKKKSMESLENYMKELGEEMSELIGKMDSSEKSMLKNKLQTLAQRVS